MPRGGNAYGISKGCTAETALKGFYFYSIWCIISTVIRLAPALFCMTGRSYTPRIKERKRKLRKPFPPLTGRRGAYTKGEQMTGYPKYHFKKNMLRFTAMLLSAVFAFSAAGCSMFSSDSEPVITEVVTSNTYSLQDEIYGAPDWVEIHNPSSGKLDISGFLLSDEPSEASKYAFPEGTVIDGNGYIVVYCIRDAVPSKDKLIAPFNLSKTGVILTLSAKDKKVIQTIEIPELHTDIAYAARKDGSFGFTTTVTPGAENAYDAIYETMKEAAEHTVISSTVCISEVMRGDKEYAEIFNPTDESINLKDFYLSDDAENPRKWRFPDYVLESGAYAVVDLMGSAFKGDMLKPDLSEGFPVFNANFRLNSLENAIYLFNTFGAKRSEIVFDVNMPENISAVLTNYGVRYTCFPTRGKVNSDRVFENIGWKPMDENDPLRINEVLRKNAFGITDSDGDRSPWVEIYNSSDHAVSLLGYYLSDSSEKYNKWAFPDITIESGEYLIVFLSDKDRYEGELHTSFRLSKYDEGVFLSTYDGMRVDGLYIPDDLSDNVSVGRGADGGVEYYPQPTPGQANSTVGFKDYMGVGGFDPSSVYISEVSATHPARTGQKDWIELYNGGDEAVSLAGWHISDSGRDLSKYQIKNLSIPAKGYAVIEKGSHGFPFGVSAAGETLILSDENCFVVDAFPTGMQRAGVTSGRLPDTEDGARVFFAQPTKGARNPENCYLSYAAKPRFSDNNVYKSEPFELEITCLNADGEIHYTLDGSKPNAGSPVYTGPLTIYKNTVVRAATVVQDLLISDTETMTFLFEEPHELPVVCLAMNEQDFSDVYAVTEVLGPVVERECSFQFFENDGRLGIETPAGVRVSGASTRTYKQKSLGLYFRGGYGRKQVTYPFFGRDYIKTFYGLVLRDAGQDLFNARMRDAFTGTAVLDMNIDASPVRFAALYVNGRYWGLYDLKENMNEKYLTSHYGVDPDTVEMIKRNKYVLSGSNEDFLRVRNYVVGKDGGGNNFVKPLTPERYEEFCQWVDEKSIMDYLIARTYFPDADMFNQKYWRTTDYKIRWRAIFYDSDYALKTSNGNVLIHYMNVVGVPSANGSLSQMDLYCGLNSSDEWRHDFIVRYIYVMKYYLNNDRLLPLFDSMKAEIDTEMDRHIARWGEPKSRSHWESEISDFRQALVARPAKAIQQLRNFYGITDAQYAEFEAEAEAIFEANGGSFK